MADLLVSTSCTLCPPEPLETSIIIDKDKTGKAHAAELGGGEKPEQNILPGTMNSGKVLNIARSATNG